KALSAAACFPASAVEVDHAPDAGTPLVGRAAEWAVIERHLRAPETPMLALRGELGIGKTRLLQEAAAQAARDGFSVLEGRCQRFCDQPYAPLRDALQRHVRGLSTARLRSELRASPWLARFLPELSAKLPRSLPALAPEQERRLMFAAVRSFLRRISGPRGTLLILDDLHWAPADGLALLAALLQGPDAMLLRVVAAYRDGELRAGEPLSRFVMDLAHRGALRQQRVGSLDAESSATLLDLLLDGTTAVVAAQRRRVLERCDGVPLFLVSYARGLRDGTVEVPATLEHSIDQRLHALPDSSRKLLTLTALIGRPVAARLLSRAGGGAEEAVEAALMAACRANLLRESADGYHFVHDIVREVIVHSLHDGGRRVLHRRIARALKGESGEQAMAELAHHYAAGGERAKALLYLERAADRSAEQLAFNVAEAHYRDLLARFAEERCSAEQARVAEKLGSLLVKEGRYDDALAALEGAVSAYMGGGACEASALALAEIGRVHALRGTPGEGMARLAATLPGLERQGPTRGLAALHVTLAHLHFVGGDYEGELSWAMRAAEFAAAAGANDLLASAHQRCGTARFLLGAVGEGVSRLEQALALAEAIDAPPIVSTCLANLAWIALETGHIDRARLIGTRALEIAERRGDQTRIAVRTTILGVAHFHAGQWERAEACLERSSAAAKRAGDAWVAAYPLIGWGQLLMARGETCEAEQSLERASAIGCRSGDLQALRRSAGLLAELDLFHGRPEAAIGRIVPLLDRSSSPEIYASVLLPALAQAYLALGRVDDAAHLADQAVARLSAAGHIVRMQALRVHGEVALARGAWEQSAASIEAALDAARQGGYRYPEAQALSALGDLNLARGCADLAACAYREALAVFRDLGARRDAEATEARLRHLERTERRSGETTA
ncbi:MAG: AAA family ATPase, partial [bacterium]|nr:AAA family ATPase [bacterium]